MRGQWHDGIATHNQYQLNQSLVRLRLGNDHNAGCEQSSHCIVDHGREVAEQEESKEQRQEQKHCKRSRDETPKLRELVQTSIVVEDGKVGGLVVGNLVGGTLDSMWKENVSE